MNYPFKFRASRFTVHTLLLVFLLTACIPEGVRVPQSPLLAALERKSGLIVYVGVDGNIYTIDQGGGEPTAVTQDAVASDENNNNFLFYHYPTWSHDSQNLAFVRFQRSGEEASQISLITAAANGSNVTETFSSQTQQPFYLSWSPDNQHVGFLSSSPSGNMLLQRVAASGGEAEILDAGEPFYWAWSPAGGRLLMHVGGNRADARLSFLNLGETVVEQGVNLRPSAFNAPAWSADGSRLLIATETEDSNKLIIIDNQGKQLQEVADVGENLAVFTWSPNNRYVAYITSDAATQFGLIGQLTVVDLENPENPITLPEEESVWGFFWSPNSEKLAYFMPQIVTPEEETSSGTSNNEPFLLLSLNVLNATNGETTEIATYLPTNDFVQLLPFFDQYQQSTTIWSPDSQNLVLTAYTSSETPELWIAAASGSLEPRPIGNALIAFWSWE